MVTVRAIPTHDIVRRTFPRAEPTEKERVAMAIGRAIDGALSHLGYEMRQGRRPTASSAVARGTTLLREALEEAAVEVPTAEEQQLVGQLTRVVQAYRKSELAGLTRPKTHVLVIDGAVAVYAQPDYWDGRGRFYEMKSYRAIPPPPDVALQVRLFQLAFPALQAVLYCLNRHVDPVEVVSTIVPPPTADEATAALRLAFELGRQFGQEKVVEYMEGPFVHYRLGDPGAAGPSPAVQ